MAGNAPSDTGQSPLLQQVMLQCYVDERQAQVYGSDVHARGKLWMRSV
jgi:hypothetical protein